MVTAEIDRGEASRSIWEALEKIPDPELPAINIVELGIVREVSVDGTSVLIRVTPTYSGCPAIAVIEQEIRASVTGLGFKDVLIETQLAPAWTTDWLSDETRKKLSASSIAPPGESTLVQLGGIACPRCGGKKTREISGFGSTACKSIWSCGDCREPFDHFKKF